MKKRLLAILLVLCFVPLCALATFNPEKSMPSLSKTPALPALQPYASAQLKDEKKESESYLIHWRYSGKPSTVAAVAEAFVQLLQEEYHCDQVNCFTVDCGSYAVVGYAFTRKCGIELSSFYVYDEQEGRSWNSGDCNVFVEYTIPDSGTSYLHFYYSPEFTLLDEGYRYVMETGGSEQVKVNHATAKPSATQKPRATEKPDASTSATR